MVYSLRICPFCNSQKVKLMVNRAPCGTNGLDDIVYRHRAYVRCMKCNARGPLVSGRVMFVSYEPPEWCSDPWDINQEACDKWNGQTERGWPID